MGKQWTLVPLRIPTGWGIRWNTLVGRTLESGETEVNDSEDLFWAVKLPRPDSWVHDTDPTSPWREIQVDVGWYRDHFRIVMLDPSRENVRHSYTTVDVVDLVDTLESWLEQIASKGDIVA